MDYVILTDYPEDFTEFAEQTGKIKAIVDIHEARQEYEWSKELEVIPSITTDPKQYGEEYKSALSSGRLFSYSLHRFSFPTIAKLGYNKIVFMDGDVKIRYDKIVSGELTEEQFEKIKFFFDNLPTIKYDHRHQQSPIDDAYQIQTNLELRILQYVSSY